jgi:uncharacterized iron-regulated membrane protein
MKKLLYQIHRWAGVVLALFMLMWFSSGLVIMYAGPSVLGPEEQLVRREVLAPQAGWLSLGEVWTQSQAQRVAASKLTGGKRQQAERLEGARLVRQGGQALWLLEDGAGQRFALSASDARLHTTGPAEAITIARQWLSHDEAAGASATVAEHTTVRLLDTGPQDSSVRNLGALRPFHRLAVGDAGRELLISARTGEVVRDTTPVARAWYWVGNWVHLLRPLDAIGLSESRRDVQIWLAGFAVAACITGLIIGWQRWRPGWGGGETYSQGRVHPYRDVWNTWHFWTGLIGGTAALLWAFSGYINTNPFEVFSPAQASKDELIRYQGGKDWPAVALNWHPTAEAGAQAATLVELSWRRLGQEAVLLGTTREGQRQAVPVAGSAQGFDGQALVSAASRLAQGVPVAAHSLLKQYDSYYYPRHHQGVVDKPLPVLRVELADAAHTHLYLDPQDGKLLLKQDSSRRVYRWLYSAVHHWDFGWLYHRPVWDAWMLAWVLFGVVLAGASVVLAYKRLDIEYKTFQKKSAKRKAAAAALASQLVLEGQSHHGARGH